MGKDPQAAAATSKEQAKPVEGVAPIVVSVTSAKRADFPIVLESLGQVQPYNTVLVRARVDGEIVKIGFKEGQIVKQGDLLAQIDPRPFQAALDQAVAKKAQDEANLANAKLDLTRYATLAKQNFATAAATRHAERAGQPTDRHRSPPTPRRSTPRRCSSTTPPSARRSPGAPASASSTRATW